MVPATHPITVYRGDAFNQPYRLRERLADGTSGDPLDLTGCTVAAQIRQDADSTTVLATFTCSLGTDLGVVNTSLTGEQTGELVGSGPIGVWDLQVTWPDGTPRTYLRGRVTLVKDVTRMVTP
jgi:hypothetical protein